MCTYTHSIQTSVNRTDNTYDPGQEQVNSISPRGKQDGCCYRKPTPLSLSAAKRTVEKAQYKRKNKEKATELTLKNTKGKA